VDRQVIWVMHHQRPRTVPACRVTPRAFPARRCSAVMARGTSPNLRAPDNFHARIVRKSGSRATTWDGGARHRLGPPSRAQVEQSGVAEASSPRSKKAVVGHKASILRLTIAGSSTSGQQVVRHTAIPPRRPAAPPPIRRALPKARDTRAIPERIGTGRFSAVKGEMAYVYLISHDDSAV
jgi:hypothetical protein